MNSQLKTCSRGRIAAAALTLAVAAPAAMAAMVATRIDGLPAGLDLTLGGTQTLCNLNGPTTGSFGPVNLTEQTTINWEAVSLPGGGIRVVERSHTAYYGQLNIPAPAGPQNCGVANTAKFNLGVAGEGNHGPSLRTGLIAVSTAPQSMSSLQVTMEATTTGLFGGNGQQATGVAPTAINRGQTQQWSASHRDSMGGTSVVTPTLDFIVQTNFPFFGATASLGRISITSIGSVCISAGSSTVCRTRAQGGTVANGNIEVDVADTRHVVLSDRADTFWRFRLMPGFPAGTIAARVAADDLDPIDYLVDSVPTTLNLLPWKSLSLPILVN